MYSTCTISHGTVVPYTGFVPRLWNQTIELHRREVRDAILDAAAALVAEHGLLAVTMSQIAATTGVARATLYRYFADVEAVLIAWHERQVGGHLDQLAAIRYQEGVARDRLEAVLEAYALISYEHHGSGLAALVHHGEHVSRAHDQLTSFVRDLVAEAAAAGDIRADIASGELAAYCLRAVSAASSLPSRAAAHRLVSVVMAGLRPPS